MHGYLIRLAIGQRSASLAALLALALLTSTAAARTWHVPSECPTINAGLDSASYGDTILVAPGTYLETDAPGTWISPGPGEWLMSEGGPEVTVIEFCSISTGIGLYHCEGARVSGFTVRFGAGPGCLLPPSPTEGIFCYNCTDVIVEDCVVENVSYGILVQGSSSEWWKPVIRNNVVRGSGRGIACYDVVDPGRPLIEGNVITDCRYGGHFMDSSPNLDANKITNCSEWGLYFWGHCGGNCKRNVIAHNRDGGVYIYADPPLAFPSFNGSLLPELANDFYGNAGCDIWYDHSPGYGSVLARYNCWGADCPDFEAKLHGEVNYSPWMDSTHTVVLNEDDCPGATEPTTWGAIKALFR